MCLRMANGVQSQEEGKGVNFRERLAVAVRSIKWSYAIFWSLSTTQTGVLEWGDGYYNGDIKTRTTVHVMDLHTDKMGLQRCEQLRELYESLLEGETDQLAKRPSGALSPEDLSDAEWYYLVCMSFMFNPGQGLPGRTLANGQSIWLCDAPHAESKVFYRSLLAKSASIQTVMCFPHLGGVVELGVTELVLEDPSLIQHIKTSLLELSKPICSGRSSSAPHNTDDDKDPVCAKVDQENLYSPMEEIRFDHDRISDLNMDSPLEECSNGCDHNHLAEDSFLLEGVNNGGASQVQSWHFMDDDFSNGAQGSIDSSDCISQAFANKENGTISYCREREKKLQECSHTKINTLGLGTDADLHYTKTLYAVLRSSHGLIDENSCFWSCDCKSSFKNWKKRGMIDDGHNRPQEAQQTMLKKVLSLVPLMHSSLCSQKGAGGNDFFYEPDGDHIFAQNVVSDKRNENGKFLILKSMVPAVSKIDKASILCDTIEYLKELEARVEELESCMDLADYDAKARRKYLGMVEHTSDNYDDTKTETSKKPWLTKRKASDINETEPEFAKIIPKETQTSDMKVSVKDADVLIEIKCAWRDYLLIDIVDAMNNMHLDAHSVQSSNIDGVLDLTLKAKFRGFAIASAGMIKQALWRLTHHQ